MFGLYTTRKVQRAKNETQIYREQSKRFADKYAECAIMIDNEQDPIKKAKMNARLAVGNTDFSDL